MSARRSLRGALLPIAWANAVVLFVVWVMHVTGRGGAGDGWRTALGALFVANCTALPCLLLLPPLLARLRPGPRALVPWTAAGVLVFMTGGLLASQLVLLFAGVLAPAHFWSQFGTGLQLGVPLALASALGAFVYGSLRERLRGAEAALLETRLAEERSRALAAEARMRSLESRLQPHFLFNTLNAISALIASDPARAEQLVGRLSKLLRASLDATARPLIPLEDELALVADYVAIEQARFGGRLQASLDVPADLRRTPVPPMAVQSLVQNAVKHGLVPQRGDGDVGVRAARRDGFVAIEVSDSGPGFELASIPAGHGIDALVQRLDALYGERASLAVARRDGRFVVEMRLPCE